jgi:hydroxypyruvate reductase
LLGPAPEGPDAVVRSVLANAGSALQGAAEAAVAHGLDLECRTERFDGEAVDVATQFVAALRATPAEGLIWVGESTVRLPARTGRGGRNTHLALAAARALLANDRITILAAGTDGTDGPTEDAGAIVDAGTIERAELAGVDVERAFREFDSGTALEASADLVHTGPTGTNVGDILIGIRDAARGRML